MGKDLKGKELGEGILQQKDGIYCARFTTNYGKRLSKKSRDLREVKQWIINAKADTSKVIQKELKIDEWYNLYFKMYLEGKRKEGTLFLKDYYWRKIQSTFGGRKINSISNYEVQEFVNELNCQLKHETLSNIVHFFYTLMESAKDNHYIVDNPCKNVNTYFMKDFDEDENTKDRVISSSDYEIIVDSAVSLSYKSIFITAMETGLRESELVGLRWKNIDFENSRIIVSEQLVYRQRLKKWERTYPKTKKGIREVPMTKNVIDALRDMETIKDTFPKSDNELFDELVFKNKLGRVVDPKDLNKRLAQICRLAKIKHVSMHDFRHTFATRCVENGIKPKTLQLLIGHKSLTTTLNIYYHSSIDDDDELQKLLQNKW